jgi:hypothetical protein
MPSKLSQSHHSTIVRRIILDDEDVKPPAYYEKYFEICIYNRYPREIYQFLRGLTCGLR